MTTVTRTNATMAHVDSSKPTKAYGANPVYLYLNNPSVGVGRYSYIFFSQPLPQHAIIDSAELRIKTKKSNSTSQTLTVSRITQTWVASKTTWSKKPAVTATDSVSVAKTTVAENTLWQFDVTNQVAVYGSATAWYGFRVEQSGNSGHSLFGKGTKAPTLVLAYHLQADAPTHLSPGTFDDAETVYVSVAKPTLKAAWDSEIPLAYVRMQMSTSSTPNWTTPTYDSGDVASLTPELRISAIGAAPAPSASGFIWWRTKFKGSDATYTEWSDEARYYYLPQGTLTITTPAVSPNNKVTASTTPVVWALSGRTQKFFQVFVTDDSVADHTPLWDSGKQQGADTSLGIPAGVLKRVGHTYTLTVRVWDDNPRQPATDATTSYPVYTQLSRDFTYELSASVDEPTALTSTPLDPKPIMQLNWSSAVAPDFFEVVRDNEVIATDLDPDDYWTGTDYEYFDRTAPPSESHVWEVRAIVGEVTSNNNPTTTNDFYTGLLWISDMENDTHVAIAGEAPATLGLVEQGAVFDPINSKYAVRVTGALGRYKGTVTGKLCGDCMEDGTTSSQLQDRMLDFREDIGKIFYLHLEKLAFPVVLYNISTYPLYGVEFGLVYGVEFSFHEVSG